MKRLCTTVLLASALGLGCQSFYTSIEKNSDDSYTLTEVNQGFWRAYGSVHSCQADGTSMKCTEIDIE